MAAWTRFEDPREAGEAMQHASGLVARLGRLSLLPWNRHDPEGSEWWMTPRDDAGPVNPAYRFGKIRFDRERGSDNLLIGYYAERGLGPRAVMPGTPASHVMNDDWLWPGFLHAMKTGEVGAALSAAAPRLEGLPVRLRVFGGAVGGTDDRFVFRWHGTPPTLTVTEAERRALLLGRLDRCTTLEEIATTLPPDDFVWVNFIVEGVFAKGPAPGSDAADEWDAERIWSSLLAPLAAWVRSGR